MTRAEDIRKDALDFVNGCKNLEPTPKMLFLCEQSMVAALYEIAAQLAELNARHAKQIAKHY